MDVEGESLVLLAPIPSTPFATRASSGSPSRRLRDWHELGPELAGFGAGSRCPSGDKGLSGSLAPPQAASSPPVTTIDATNPAACEPEPRRERARLDAARWSVSPGPRTTSLMPTAAAPSTPRATAGVIGAWRMRTPVASKNAFATAEPTAVVGGSPEPARAQPG